MFFVYAFEMLADDLIVNNSGHAAASVHTPLNGLISTLLKEYTGSGWLIDAIVLAVLVGVAYVAGHALASVSSLMIDRLYIAKGHGYPHERLLFTTKSGESRTPLSRSHYRELVFGLPIAAFMLLLVDVTCKAGWTQSWLYAAPIGVILFLVVESFLKLWASSPGVSRSIREMGYEEFRDSGHWRSVRCRMIEDVFPFVHDCLAKLLASTITTKQELTRDLREKHVSCMSSCFRLVSEQTGSNNWWFPYMHVRVKSPVLSAMVDNWLCLFSFARNLAAALFFASMYGMIWLVVYRNELAGWVWSDVTWLLVFAGSCSVLSAVMLFRYYYIYAHYYTRFVLRAFIYVCETEDR